MFVGSVGYVAFVYGKRQRRESKPGAARKWVGYFCPTPKGTPDQCDVVWED